MRKRCVRRDVGTSVGDRNGIVERRAGVDIFVFFFFNDTATTEIYTLSLHDALPIYQKSNH